MDSATETLIRDTFAASNGGRLHFGEAVERLAKAGVESYAADYRGRRSTCYRADGSTLDIGLDTPPVAIPAAFDAAALKAAIRGAQRGAVMYPEFKRLSMAAGCVGYTVWIAGRHVAYHGRQGETHIERFPD
jgi:uncharacterized protein YbcV (DUF1398 family)